jgi:hypothetical protein
MRKIKALKGRWIQNAEGDLINLNSFIAIRKATSEDGLIIQGILFRDERSWLSIAVYGKKEKKMWEDDFNFILKIINS